MQKIDFSIIYILFNIRSTAIKMSNKSMMPDMTVDEIRAYVNSAPKSFYSSPAELIKHHEQLKAAEAKRVADEAKRVAQVNKKVVQIKTPSMSKGQQSKKAMRPLSPPTQTMIPQSLFEEQQRFQVQQQMIYQQQRELKHAEMQQLELLQWEHQRLMQQNMIQMQKPQYFYDERGMLRVINY